MPEGDDKNPDGWDQSERPQFSVGSVEGVPFTACTSGPDIIILASNFLRVQQITASSPISSLDCSTDVGKIGASYDNKIVIYEPIPLVQQQQQPSNNSAVTKLDYKWVQTATIESDSSISVMSFSLEGTRLIAGGKTLQLWNLEGTSKTNWQCIWSCKTACRITYLKYSPDGALFCSAGKSDRLVKIWYESVTNTSSLSVSNSNVFNDQANTTLSTPNCLSPLAVDGSNPPTFLMSSSSNFTGNNQATSQNDGCNTHPLKQKFDFSFIYIAHPLPVTGIEWRRTSKYTPRGAVANILITSCEDNIARIWVQTLLPDDGLVNFNQLKSNQSEEDLVNGAPRVQHQRHRQKLLRRLKRMKAFSQFKKRQNLALDHSLEELEKVANSPAAPTTNTNIIVHNEHPTTLPSSNNAIHLNGLASRNPGNGITSAAIPSALSAQDFHSYAICSSVIKPGLHFHLAGVIESDFEIDRQSSSSMKMNDKTLTGTTTNDDQVEVGERAPQFVVHWINNKEIHITRSIELLLHDMLIRILRGNNPTSSSTNSPQSAGDSCSGSENDIEDTDDPNDDTITAESSKKLRHKLCRKMNKQRALAASGRKDPADSDDNAHTNSNRLYPNSNGANNGRASPTSLVEEFDKALESLLKKWQMSTDLVFSINKSDGTLTLWQLKYLDGEDIGVFRQVQIDKLSCLKAALPHYDATTMSLNVSAYSPSAYLDVKRAFLAVTNSSATGPNFIVGDQFSPVDVPEILSINTDSVNSSGQSIKTITGLVTEAKDSVSASSISDAEPSIFIVTQHLSGILGLWKFNFDSSYPMVQNVDLVTRITGLPIDPSWLRDGTIYIEYHNAVTSLITEWVPDEKGGKFFTLSARSPTHLKDRSFNFEDAKTNLVNNLPALNEESDTRPSSVIDIHNQESQPNANKLNDTRDSYKASQLATRVNLLPQYHLKQLIELLAFGKLQRVKAILNHLVNCLVLSEISHEKETDSSSNTAPWAHRSRTLSIVAQTPPTFQDSFDIDNPSSTIQQHVVEEIELDYIEVTSIKPLPLYSLLEADTEKPNSGDSKSSAFEEFSTSYENILRTRSQVDETLDEILGQTTINTLNKQKELKKFANDATGKGSLTNFNPQKAKLLTQVLTHTHLPGLSNVDQMHLLAVADAVALFDASPEDLNEAHDDDGYDSRNGSSMVLTNIAIDSLDDRGLRFLTAMRQHVYLTRCLPMKQRTELKSSGIGNDNIVWAFHSESQDELISLIPCVQRNKPEWSELREFGIGWWLKKLEVLRKLIEKVAQSAYQAKQDPLDAALFYLAMKKKTLVCALLRRVNCDKRLLKLFEQDFNDPVNRKKALKNAYALLGLHRFEHAAAFFILAGSIWDAVEVCINNLNDVQLAMILIRLYDNDSNIPFNLKKLLFTEILGSRRPTEPASVSASTPGINLRNNQDRRMSSSGLQQYSYDPRRAHQDPFLRSIAFWKLGDYLSAVHTLLESNVGQYRHRPSMVQVLSVSNSSTHGSNSRRNSDLGQASDHQMACHIIGSTSRGNVSVSASVFNFYLFLKDQPLVVKHRQQLIEETEIKARTSPVEEEQVHCHRARSLSSGELGFDEQGLSRTVKQSSTEFDVLNDTTHLVDKYSDEAMADRERTLFFSTANSYLEAGCPLLALEVLGSEDHLNMSKAQRMKFIACLHIIMNELNTLANSSHISPGLTTQKFGSQFFEWLKESAKAMNKICSYSGVQAADAELTVLPHEKGFKRGHFTHLERAASTSASASGLMRAQPLHSTSFAGALGETAIASDSYRSGAVEKGTQEDVDRICWIRRHEPMLRTMLTYCNLHSATENSLTTVRLEILALLKRLL